MNEFVNVSLTVKEIVDMSTRSELENQMAKLEAEAAKLRAKIESMPNEEPVNYKKLINFKPIEISGCRLDMADAPLTQGQYNAICKLPKVEIRLNPKTIKPGEEDLPVVEINYFEALEVAARLSKETGEQIDLPTDPEWVLVGREQEAEMERAGKTTLDVAWVWENSGGKLQKVRTKWANQFGVYDLFGNVWEWMKNPNVELKDAPSNLK